MTHLLRTALVAIPSSAGVTTGALRLGSLAQGGATGRGEFGSQTVFRTGTTLVEFSLVALDGSRRPVADLEKEDVVVTELGRWSDIGIGIG